MEGGANTFLIKFEFELALICLNRNTVYAYYWYWIMFMLLPWFKHPAKKKKKSIQQVVSNIHCFLPVYLLLLLWPNTLEEKLKN